MTGDEAKIVGLVLLGGCRVCAPEVFLDLCDAFPEHMEIFSRVWNKRYTSSLLEDYKDDDHRTFNAVTQERYYDSLWRKGD